MQNKTRLFIVVLIAVLCVPLTFSIRNVIWKLTGPKNLQKYYYTSLKGIQPDEWRRLYKFDQNGVPMVDYGQEGVQYNATTASQFGLSSFNRYIERGDRNALRDFYRQVDFIRTNHIEISENTIGFPYNFRFPKYDLEPIWYSAIAQGQVLSLLSRAYLLNNDPEILRMMVKTKNLLVMPKEDGGLLVHTPEGYIWLEEYPTAEPSFVLNGFMFAMIGLHDYMIWFPEDVATREIFDQTLESLKNTLRFYDNGEWVLYDRYYFEPVDNRYMYVQILETKHLYEITGNPWLLTTSETWSKYKR